MASHIFTYNLASIDTILASVRKNFSVLSEFDNNRPGEFKRLVITNNQCNSLNLMFYKTGKIMVQGKEGIFFDNICTHLSSLPDVASPQKDFTETKSAFNENEIYKTKEIIIGFDEAGKGEAIGDMVLGSVYLHKEKLPLFANLKSDIKSLTLKELSYWCKVIKDNGIRFEYEIVSAMKISNSPFIINRQMDQDYVTLIRKYSGILNKYCILAIDDYNIQDELKTHLSNLKKNGVESIVGNRMDENITATKLASVIARHIRLTNTEFLEQKNRIQENGKVISFGKGAPNQQTDDWLRSYRLQNPYFDFPDFVRKKWGNVQEIELTHPKKECKFIIVCPVCDEKIGMLKVFFDKQTDPIYFCHKCNNIIDISKLKDNPINHCIADTSAYVAGLISKDIQSKQSLLLGTCLIKPKKIIDEIDTIGKSQKMGALNELEKLRILEEQGKLTISPRDFEITNPFDADNKLYGMIAKNNSSALLTADKNLAINSHSDGAFVIHIINYVPTKTS